MESENLRRQQKTGGNPVVLVEEKLDSTGLSSSSSSSSALTLMPGLKSEPVLSAIEEITINVDDQDQDSPNKSRTIKRSSNRRQSSARPTTSSSSTTTNTNTDQQQQQQQRSKKKSNQRNKLNLSDDSLPSHNELSNKKIQFDEQQFTKNALFHSPSSLLTKLDLKTLFQPLIFESLPRQSQLKLIKLLPECDRQLDSHGSFK